MTKREQLCHLQADMLEMLLVLATQEERLDGNHGLVTVLLQDLEAGAPGWEMGHLALCQAYTLTDVQTAILLDLQRDLIYAEGVTL